MGHKIQRYINFKELLIWGNIPTKKTTLDQFRIRRHKEVIQSWSNLSTITLFEQRIPQAKTNKT